ncbi:hypothetical protein KBC89_05100 [Candidatus Woesebacteria bacterium]|nr:hypothetical protein [Candidatus Woesebacteria bacterium]
MTDDQATNNQATDPTTSNQVSDGAGPATAQDPLAILESILQDAKNKSGQKKAQGDVPAQQTQQLDDGSGLVDGEPPPTEEELAIIKQQIEQEEAARTAELEVQRQQQIAQQQALLSQELPQTPQYQARQQQVAEEEQEKATSVVADGYEIAQLTKTKVPIQE